jgi:hypothetical protein
LITVLNSQSRDGQRDPRDLHVLLVGGIADPEETVPDRALGVVVAGALVLALVAQGLQIALPAQQEGPVETCGRRRSPSPPAGMRTRSLFGALTRKAVAVRQVAGALFGAGVGHVGQDRRGPA